MVSSEYAGRLAAVSSASRLLVEAGVDQSRQIDVFGLVESLGLWLAFFPLDGLLGAYLPEGEGGILVTTERSVPIQRYTAAHELGHWRLDGGPDGALDSEADVLGRSDIERETLAQVFAGALLMPPPLVHSILSRRNSTSIGPLDVYTVAREAGVSYEAAARQLHHLDRITRSELREVLRVQPRSVKQLIGAGSRPVVGAADVWPVDLSWHGHHLNVRADDEIVVSLPEDRSTGFRWSVGSPDPRPRRSAAQPPPPFADSPPLDSGALSMAVSKAMPHRKPAKRAVDRARQPVPKQKPEPLPIVGERATVVGDVYVADGSAQVPTDAAIRRRRLARLGASASHEAVQDVRNENIIAGYVGRRVFSVRLSEPGTTHLRFVLSNEFSDSDLVDEYRITATVEERRGAFSIDQIRREDDDLADVARERRRSGEVVSADEAR
ncbi:MAG: ImmA/IrrE family metallo-endopeptidase [Acidimicrobiaceae bacterium]|nr:ImmA/IrrE family metallo-endopeptidase [Acidimicrobiaceae bacterium]MYD05963.1 ImmA/IrrE family metallo-endopeptidase [Acidimicrobiaceae bacterium]MYG54910.1 ImmA/IrrE family metallo-endopeptidase [Acidimicrobiaceae bacterium]MYI58628.1 ImmA/IrrE family metallo-endopeptidase [Acidimicrobiaceae bacterium]MYJ98533.1 ImmA/IrrE family metallo-endopeptidase [Acidimicrobiaceae bacterium]